MDNERTSHTLIVILTAKVDAEAHLEGLRRGAEACLANLFNLEELNIRLENLIEVHKKLRQFFERYFR